MVGDSSENTYREDAVGGHSHHYGRVRSWVLVGVVIAAFCVGAIAIVGHLWVLFWVCAGVVVLSVPAGKLVGIMDDTVAVEPAPRSQVAVGSGGSAAHRWTRRH